MPSEEQTQIINTLCDDYVFRCALSIKELLVDMVQLVAFLLVVIVALVLIKLLLNAFILAIFGRSRL